MRRFPELLYIASLTQGSRKKAVPSNDKVRVAFATRLQLQQVKRGLQAKPPSEIFTLPLFWTHLFGNVSSMASSIAWYMSKA
mmetsp:Transcript_98694/g.175705  ORF Transcript_98694/g.175705 Transcript_98694/m.175705 type:complete len:82 (+) Transcript_98694:34-279(+)